MTRTTSESDLTASSAFSKTIKFVPKFRRLAAFARVEAWDG